MNFEYKHNSHILCHMNSAVDMKVCLDWSRLPHFCGLLWEIQSVGKLINSINDLLVTRLVIIISSRDIRFSFENPYVALSFVTVTSHPQVGEEWDKSHPQEYEYFY